MASARAAIATANRRSSSSGWPPPQRRNLFWRQPTGADAPAAATEARPSGAVAVSTGGPATVPASPNDPGEAAYSEGFKLWESGRYDDSITSLRAFASAYPKHRRVSFANNLIGRALLDKGERARRGPGTARQLPRQSEGRARARQPLLSRPGADEAWPAGAGVQGVLPNLTRSMARKCGPTSRNSRQRRNSRHNARSDRSRKREAHD